MRSPLIICPAALQRFQKNRDIEKTVLPAALLAALLICLWFSGWAVRDGWVQGLQATKICGCGLLGAEQLLHDFGGGEIALAEGVGVFAQGSFSIAVSKSGGDGDGIHIAGQ